MKNVFLIILGALITFSQVVNSRRPGGEGGTGLPVLYWATDMNPTRTESVRRYRAWLKRNGYPDMDVKPDPNNGSLQKIIVQSTSGVGPDLINVFGWDVTYLNQMGLFEELGPLLSDLPVPAENHDPTVSNDLFVDGKRVAYSLNAGTSYYFVNEDLFPPLGQPLPPESWNFDEFESYGKRYVEAANRGNRERHHKFYCNGIDRDTMRRSLGFGFLDETLSGPTLDSPEQVAMLKRIYKWIYEDRLFPTAADWQSLVIGQSSSGADGTSLHRKGFYALAWSGLPVIIGMRETQSRFRLGIAECPHGGFRNSISRTYTIGLYSGGRQKELARYFLLYLTQEPHNMQIADNGDQMPPIPSFRERDEFLKPGGWTNEWKARVLYKNKLRELAIPGEYSPYAAYSQIRRAEHKAVDGYFSKVYTAEEACRHMQDEVRGLLQRGASRSRELQARYQRALANQAKIDAAKAAGKKVPLALVENPFLWRYLRDTGRGE